MDKRPNPPRVCRVPVQVAPVSAPALPPVCQVTPPSTPRPGVAEAGLRAARACGGISRSGNVGPYRRAMAEAPVPTSRADDFPRRCRDPVAEDGAVLGAEGAPGNVAVVARAHRTGAPGSESDRNVSCAPSGPSPARPCTCRETRGVRGATHRLGMSCEASPQISAPALVRTHQGQLTGTCKLFGMPRNRNTAAPPLVVIT